MIVVTSTAHYFAVNMNPSPLNYLQATTFSHGAGLLELSDRTEMLQKGGEAKLVSLRRDDTDYGGCGRC